MITLITGVPGSGKSLHAVSDLLLPMQGAEIEHEGVKVKRTLKTNIKNLLLDHDHIDKDDLLKWHEWAKPGDLICFDEVQEVWRPRSMSAAAPESITKLEIHRHMAVDFVIITQHPMLLDQNIRRLVGRHLHVRRVANMALAVVYEWDHASNPSMVKSAITTRPWRYPKGAYKLYKSAEAHTKQPRRLPFALLVVAVAIVGLGYGAWTIQGRMSERFGGKPPALSSKSTVDAAGNIVTVSAPVITKNVAVPVALLPVVPVVPAAPVPEMPLGCIASATRCSCFDQSGFKVPMPDAECRVASQQLVYILRDVIPVAVGPSVASSVAVGSALPKPSATLPPSEPKGMLSLPPLKL